MEPISPFEQVFVCQTCGDKGFANAFVYCAKCLNFVIHRYCLNVMPRTPDERVIWYCEDCEQNQVAATEVKSLLSQKKEDTSSGLIKATNHKKKQKKEKDTDYLIAKTEEVVYHHIPEKNNTNTKSIQINSQPIIARVQSNEVCYGGKSRCEAVGRSGIQTDETAVADTKAYSVRPGEHDRVFYLRTGKCASRSICRSNHPPRIGQVNQHGGESPERVGEPDCVAVTKRLGGYKTVDPYKPHKAGALTFMVRIPTRVRKKRERVGKNKIRVGFRNVAEDPPDLTDQGGESKHEQDHGNASDEDNEDSHHSADAKDSDSETKIAKLARSPKLTQTIGDIYKSIRKDHGNTSDGDDEDSYHSLDSEASDSVTKIAKSERSSKLTQIVEDIIEPIRKESERIEVKSEPLKKRNTIGVMKGSHNNKSIKINNSCSNSKSKNYGSLRTRTSPNTLFLTIQSLTNDQKIALKEIGFHSLMDFKIHNIPAKLGYFVVDRFDEKSMRLTTDSGFINVTKDCIHDTLGIPIGGIDIYSLKKSANDNESFINWKNQFKSYHIGAVDLGKVIKESGDSGRLFKLNFILLFVTTMCESQKSGKSYLKVIHRLVEDVDISSVDWCKYLLNCLVETRKSWKDTDKENFYNGPLTFLTLLYVDRFKGPIVKVTREKPVIKTWDSLMLKARQMNEIEHGGFGKYGLELNDPVAQVEQSKAKATDGVTKEVTKLLGDSKMVGPYKSHKARALTCLVQAATRARKKREKVGKNKIRVGFKKVAEDPLDLTDKDGEDVVIKNDVQGHEALNAENEEDHHVDEDVLVNPNIESKHEEDRGNASDGDNEDSHHSDSETKIAKLARSPKLTQIIEDINEQISKESERIEMKSEPVMKRKAVGVMKGSHNNKSIKINNSCSNSKSKNYGSLRTRTSPNTLFLTIQSLTNDQKIALKEIGFHSLMDFKIHNIPAKLGYFVVDRFDEKSMRLTTDSGFINVTTECIHDTLGIPIGGIDIHSLKKSASDNESVIIWKNQFKSSHIGAVDLGKVIKESGDSGRLFKLNFILLFVTTMCESQKSGKSYLKVIHRLVEDVDISSIDWCKFLLNCLVETRKCWKDTDREKYYNGPLTFLTLLYVDRFKAPTVEVTREKPVIKAWDSLMLKARQTDEIEHGGFGKYGLELNDPIAQVEEPTAKATDGVTKKKVKELRSKLERFIDYKKELEDLLQKDLENYPDNQEFVSIKEQYLNAIQNVPDFGQSSKETEREEPMTPQDANILIRGEDPSPLNHISPRTEEDEEEGDKNVTQDTSYIQWRI